jgi:hypothetical protein
LTSGIDLAQCVAFVAQPTKPNVLGLIISVAILVGLLWYFLGGGVENKVADDAVKEYEITKRNGTRMPTAMQPSFVGSM